MEGRPGVWPLTARRGPAGPWLGCGCSSFLMIAAGILLVFAGCARMLNF